MSPDSPTPPRRTPKPPSSPRASYAPSAGTSRSLEGIAKALSAEAETVAESLPSKDLVVEPTVDVVEPTVVPATPEQTAPSTEHRRSGTGRSVGNAARNNRLRMGTLVRPWWRRPKVMAAAAGSAMLAIGGMTAVAFNGSSEQKVPDQLAATAPDDAKDPTPEAPPDVDVVEEAPLGDRFAHYADGKITLIGPVPDAATSAALEAKTAQVVGAENVINEYVIDPRAPKNSDGRVIVDDPIYFEEGSEVINEEFFPLLDLGVVVLRITPDASMRLIGHSDSQGDEADNIELSRRRAQSIADYLVERGIGPDRIEVVGMGSAEPVADNATDAGRAENRRIEVEILNLID